MSFEKINIYNHNLFSKSFIVLFAHRYRKKTVLQYNLIIQPPTFPRTIAYIVPSMMVEYNCVGPIEHKKQRALILRTPINPSNVPRWLTSSRVAYSIHTQSLALYRVYFSCSHARRLYSHQDRWPRCRRHGGSPAFRARGHQCRQRF